ncbi:23S rRNA (adenine2030-N6)-methyltransferase [Paraperlucidibaca baekdonensis]|uniref:Ribosomal RNA large subunit methyltransferase J n=1 Tax=Paraperlucidibaca baekdonensis TaxID=748120 RepID=A0A3E0HA39_9GAMM|nr:23S rRNA (adenine(2030)-N(6))-methyltransferase RlmJ [Paraperlucidibaca baekdonensis]REH40410.1 23S rRNA (adenine2030-N6)-methyltransferase [Paraperlucidibaca baekdonensis]
MNYRHHFHAGNFADVMKHSLQMGLMAYLKKKDSAFCYIDTHAGAGIYDLHGTQAQKTGEYQQGIDRLDDHRGAPVWVADYLQGVLACQAAGARSHYPGSPWLGQRQLRAQDSAILIDVQHAEVASLRHYFHADARIAVHQRNAYEGLIALIPPKEKRGLVLIDPPYELERDSFPQLVKLIVAAHKKWPTGVYGIWFPIKQRASIVKFYRELMNSGINKMLACELLMQPDDNALGLNGSGLIVINPPWGFYEEAQKTLSWLVDRLSDHPQRASKVRWLVNIE